LFLVYSSLSIIQKNADRMIYLTGDVHHAYRRNLEQRYSDKSEVQLALEYAVIAEKHGLKATLFCTGKTVEQEPDKMRELASRANVELGGHTYSAFESIPKEVKYLLGKIWGCSYGPRFIQERDISKTISAMKKIDVDISSWRTHAFSSNNVTQTLLADKGIMVLSDYINRKQTKPYKKNNLIHLPINTIVDHDSLLHAHVTEGSGPVGSQNNPGGLSAGEYLNILCAQVKEINEQKGDAVILCHPMCMHTLDGFDTFRLLCDYLSQYDSLFAREAIIHG